MNSRRRGEACSLRAAFLGLAGISCFWSYRAMMLEDFGANNYVTSMHYLPAMVDISGATFPSNDIPIARNRIGVIPPVDGTSRILEGHPVAPLPFPAITASDTSWLGDEWQDEECKPTAKWQLRKFSPYSCNAVHELDIDPITSGLRLLKCGGDRCAYLVRDSQGQEVVFKTLRKEKYGDAPDSAWKDTIVMERLTSSPFVLNIYGNCGISQLTEVAEDSLYTQLVYARENGDQMTPEQKLRIGYHVAAGVADMHSIGNRPSVAHNDISSEQILLVNGVYKLSDFHLSSFMTQDKNGTNCKEEGKRMHQELDKSRAPEEIMWRYGNSTDPIHRDKSDVWILGTVLGYVLTKRWDFEGLTVDDAKQLLMNGRHSFIPEIFVHSSHAADRAMVGAIEMAWVADPYERPSARQIANYLKSELAKLTNETGVYQVSVPEIPTDFVVDDHDWYENYRDTHKLVK